MKRTPIKPGRRASRSLQERRRAAAWWDAAMKSTEGRCVVTGRYAEEIHHAIPRQSLRHRGLDIWDPRNGVPVTRRTHERHTTAVERIPRECLPASVEEYASEIGLTHLLDRYYGARVVGSEAETVTA